MSKTSEKKSVSNGVLTTTLVVKLLICLTLVLYIVLGWQNVIKEINIYLNNAIISLYVLLIANVLQGVTKYIVKKCNFTSARSRTVSTLISSLVKYLIAIVAIVVIMIQFLGYNYMTELFAGLGVVTLIVGLGCQSLITDIIAGIFMVFEGNYEVGDVVVVNGWRGTVNEIGLRTTVVEDIGGNLKIINNSSITEIINNSQVLSYACCYVGIEYEESLERVENVISKNLEQIQEKIPEIVEGPFYRGVNELGSSSVNLLFVAQCKEEDKFSVQRQLNRQLKLLFDKHNINIPYSQLTISNKVEKEIKASAKQQKNAENFVNDQKEKSKLFDDEQANG